MKWHSTAHFNLLDVVFPSNVIDSKAISSSERTWTEWARQVYCFHNPIVKECGLTVNDECNSIQRVHDVFWNWFKVWCKWPQYIPSWSIISVCIFNQDLFKDGIIIGLDFCEISMIKSMVDNSKTSSHSETTLKKQTLFKVPFSWYHHRLGNCWLEGSIDFLNILWFWDNCELDLLSSPQAQPMNGHTHAHMSPNDKNSYLQFILQF